jgi:hypothetical protein
VRMAELSHRSGVSVATIKYYVREGLLPAGTRTPNGSTTYHEHHLRRLLLIRALREAGGLSVAATAQLLRTAADPPWSRPELVERVQQALLIPPGSDTAPRPPGPELATARGVAAACLRHLGWRISEQGPALDRLAEAMAAAVRLDHPELLTLLPGYAAAALAVAEQETALRGTPAASDRDPTALAADAVLGGAMLAAMRLLAHEHLARARNARGHRAAAPRGAREQDTGATVTAAGADATPG